MKIQLYSNAGDLQETIEIEKKVCSGAEGWDYIIRNRKARNEGCVEIRFRNLRYFEERNDPITNPLIEIVEFDYEIIAELQKVCPHGSWIPRKGLEGRGIGTGVLKTVLHDVIVEGVNFAYCRNPAPRLYSLLSKEGFERLVVDNDPNEHLFKVLAR